MKRSSANPAERHRPASMNALKHGLTSNRMFVLETETPEEWRRMLDTWTEKLRPRDAAELQIVAEAAFARWRMQRVWNIETTLLGIEMNDQEEKIDDEYESVDPASRQAFAFKGLADGSLSLELIHRYETRYRRSFERALATLEKLRKLNPATDSETQPAPQQNETKPMPQLIAKLAPPPSARPQNKFLPNETEPPRSPVDHPLTRLK